MSTYDQYTVPVPPGTWDVQMTGAARFTWEYDEGRQRLLDLYQRGKDKQWDAAKRIDWDQPVNPVNVMEMSDEFCPIYGSGQWERLSQTERDVLNHHLSAWLFSQFLHGEQGALTVAARIVESVPDMDSKFYAATQAMDEARHVELYSRFINMCALHCVFIPFIGSRTVQPGPVSPGCAGRCACHGGRGRRRGRRAGPCATRSGGPGRERRLPGAAAASPRARRR
jgi:hypothetical protein